MNDLSDIHSPANIARSRARAENIRQMVAAGELDDTWLRTAAEVEAYASQREREAYEDIRDRFGGTWPAG